MKQLFAQSTYYFWIYRLCTFDDLVHISTELSPTSLLRAICKNYKVLRKGESKRYDSQSNSSVTRLDCVTFYYKQHLQL